MSRYVININEKSKAGKLVWDFLSQHTDNKNVSLLSLEEFEATEEKMMMEEMKKADKTPLIGYDEIKAELTRLKSKLKK